MTLIAVQVMRLNKRRRESHASNISLTPNFVRTLLLSRDWQAPTYDEGGFYTHGAVSLESELGLEGHEEDAAPNEGSEDDSSEDGGIGNPRECIIS